jgi:hypothetical protein
MASAMVEDANFEDDQLANMNTDEIVRASRLLDNEIRILKVQFLFPFFYNFFFQFSSCVTLSC